MSTAPTTVMQPWRPGDVVLLTDDNVTAGHRVGDKRAVPIWDREWDKPDIAHGDHNKVDDAFVDERVLVLHVTTGVIKTSALVMTQRGRVGYVHADEAEIAGKIAWQAAPGGRTLVWSAIDERAWRRSS